MLILGKKAIRKNLTIKPIVLSEADSKKLVRIMNSERSSPLYRRRKMKEIIVKTTGGGGGCHSCNNLPTHILNYHVNHCIIVEKYCKDCLQKEGLI